MIISQVDRLWYGHHFHFALERWRRGEGGGQAGGGGWGWGEVGGQKGAGGGRGGSTTGKKIEHEERDAGEVNLPLLKKCWGLQHFP